MNNSEDINIKLEL